MVVKAQWSGDPAVNNKIADNTTLSAGKSGVVSINDGNNNMIIAWVGTSVGSTGNDIYIQKINKDGTLPWGATEKVVCNAVGTQTTITMVSDGKGGAILAWTDYRFAAAPATSGSNSDEVYGQRVKADGSIAWAANGVILSKAGADASKYRRNPVIEKVSDKDFIVVWRQLETTADLFAQKIDTLGVLQWAADVDVHGPQTGTQTNQILLSDGAGGVFVVWQDPRATTSDIYGQRISGTGALLWGANGKAVCDATSGQTIPHIVKDGSGGLVVTWADFRNGDNDIFAQRLDSMGVRQWSVGLVSDANYLNGVPIAVINTASINNQTYPQIISDLNNHFIIAWTDNRNTLAPLSYGFDVYAQKIDLNGGIKWSANGVPVVSRTGNQGNSTSLDMYLNNGLNGDVFVTFRDVITTSPANNDIYVQRLNSSDGGSTAPFVSYGVPVSTNAATVSNYNVISDGAGGLIVAWADARSGTASEIYASRLYANGTLPVTYASFTASKNTLNEVSLVWNIASEINTDEYLIERKGETGDFVTIGIVKAQKLSSYNFTDRNPLLENNYYRIKAKDFDGTLSYSDIRTIKIDALNADALNIYPNPTSDRLNVNITKAGKYQLKLVDQSGKIVLNKSIELNSGVNDLGVSLSSFSSGVYYLTLTNDVHYINKKIIKL